MADCYSNYLRDKINDLFRRATAFTYPATSYFAALTTLGTASGGQVEAAGYSRLSFANNTTNWAASSGQTSTNQVALSFGTNSGSTATIVGIAEFDASSGGNLLTFAALTTPLVVNNGDPLTIPVGAGVFNWAT